MSVMRKRRLERLEARQPSARHGPTVTSACPYGLPSKPRRPPPKPAGRSRGCRSPSLARIAKPSCWP